MAARSVSFVVLGHFLCFIAVFSFTSANFVFEFKLSSVTANGTCDTIFDSFDPDCETYVSFCLRERSSSESTNTDDCPLGSSGRIDAYPLPGTQQRSITSERSWPVRKYLAM